MSRWVIKSDLAKKKVFEFSPPKFEMSSSPEAQHYLQAKSKGADFRMSDAIRIQTGVEGIETADFETQVEEKTLEKIKDIQELAYKEAYSLGLQEGKAEAFLNSSTEINEKLEIFQNLISSISTLKTELFKFNEAHLVQLAFHMASRLALGEITARPDLIKDIIKSSLEVAQNEEEVTIQISPLQAEFLEKLKIEASKDFSFMKKVKLETNEQVSVGGCIIETNYGEIDARFEQRVQKLWETLSENLYRVKDTISAD